MTPVGRFAVSVVLVVPLALAGCTTSQGCPGFVSYETPADAAADADAVVVGTVVDRVGTTPMFAGTANVWTFAVDDWVKGDGEGRITVISMPPQCGGGDMYFGADPFATARDEGAEAALFLHDEGGRWRTLTPIHGIVRAESGGVPEEWPPGASDVGGS